MSVSRGSVHFCGGFFIFGSYNYVRVMFVFLREMTMFEEDFYGENACRKNQAVAQPC